MTRTLGHTPVFFSCRRLEFLPGFAGPVLVVSHILDHYQQKRPILTVVGNFLDHYHHSNGKEEDMEGTTGGV